MIAQRFYMKPADKNGRVCYAERSAVLTKRRREEGEVPQALPRIPSSK